MADIAAENRVDPGAERVETVERHSVRLAAEKERLRIGIEPVFLAGGIGHHRTILRHDNRPLGGILRPGTPQSAFK
jgi:hypothetical protein